MKMPSFNSVACCLTLCVCLGLQSQISAQATAPLYDPPPSYPGFQLPHVAGTLKYSFTGSEIASVGNQNLSYSQTIISGNMGYISRSPTSPFSMIYSGGYGISTGSQTSRVFQNLSLSKVVQAQRWQFLLADSLNYLPSSPVAGLSGIAGVGDLGAAPIQGVTDPDLQSNDATRITNTASASVSRLLTGRTSLTGSGSYEVYRFPGNNPGLEFNIESGNLGVSHTVSPRTHVGGTYFYTHQTYKGLALSTDSQGLNFSVSHVWSARLNGSFFGGPVHTSSTGVPGTTNVNFGAGVFYVKGLNTYSAQASRQVRTGSGVTTGTRADSFGGAVSRKLSRFSNVSVRAFYVHSTTLPSLISPPYTISGVDASVQASRSLSRTLSAYASYNIRRQETPTNTFAVNALQGAYQTIGFGLTYTPRPITVGRQ